MNKVLVMRVFLVVLLLGLVAACNLNQQTVEDIPDSTAVAQDDTATPTNDEVEELFASSEPLPTMTPSVTLRPPPTIEPPTLTPEPSNTPTITPTATIEIEGNLPPLLGLDTPTLDPDDPDACQINEDWILFYEVQANDALARIAEIYNTSVDALVEGNCLPDENLIRVGQMLRVPGELHPAAPEFVCDPWELLTPFNGTITVPGEGTITFNWRGPEAPRYLVRIYRTEDGTGDFVEYLTEFRDDYTLDLSEIPEGGLYSWRVFPIGMDFRQIPCQESYHSIFVKEAAPPTSTPFDPTG